MISFKERTNKEIQRRLALGWQKYWSLKDIMKGNFGIAAKKHIFESCILPVVSYGCQTWSLTAAEKRKINVWQHSVERSMTGIKKIYKIRCTEIRKKTGLRDALLTINKLKWDWTGHLMRKTDERWSLTATEWTPYNLKRRRGRQPKRWADFFRQEVGPHWTKVARDRDVWRRKWKELAADSASQ
uniref:Putative endonuclease-reverse transcriptase panstrongylus megistus n=1 Tax=Rhodnius prolixus TaxID=13249 RepID=A0A4P6D9I7_RHOPR